MSTTGSSSLGTDFVTGRKRVPRPATGRTALRTTCAPSTPPSLPTRGPPAGGIGSSERTDAPRRGPPVDAISKAPLRAATLAARRALSDAQRREASVRIVERLLRLPELREASTVLVYAALREEVDLTTLLGPLHERGARTLFPRVRGDRLDLVAAVDLGTLQLGHRGVREPGGRAVDPAVVDIAVVPGVAFDPRGGRLGAGGGHYDRLLAELAGTTIRIGAAFDCQLVPHIPRQAHDQPVDLVVTERSVHRVARP
ncbi:MAG: 5-formyltetrahydrofolate cyclo-ligase [Nitriliruptor sp.]|nr:MAG: 5-formyltetrahydrofolate cyclo-ligase [Nitriliruptor sp.]